ncbi:hypothetical protein KCU98_g3807, partial [Aureobasidium melanogenum]
MAPSPPTTFRLKDLPSEIFKLVLNNVDKSDLPAIRSTCRIPKEETDDHFHVAFFTEIECDLSQRKLEKLVWLSKQSQLACHIKTLLFSIHDNYTARSIHRLVDVVINNLSFFSNSLTLGVTSQQWNHPSFSRHCGQMTEFLNNRLVPLADIISIKSWKIVTRTDNLRHDRDMNLADCFSSIAGFVGSELRRDATSPLGIELEIHERAGDPTRYITVTKGPASRTHAILENFNCEQPYAGDNGQPLTYTLDDAVFTQYWNTDSLTIRNSVFLLATLHMLTRWNTPLKHLILENVGIRYFVSDEFDIEPLDWIDTLQRLQLGNLESCRLVNLYDGNGDFFVEGVWEFTATPYCSVSNAIAGLIENVQRARAHKDEAEAQ